jgi:hypothetical protein
MKLKTYLLLFLALTFNFLNAGKIVTLSSLTHEIGQTNTETISFLYPKQNLGRKHKPIVIKNRRHHSTKHPVSAVIEASLAKAKAQSKYGKKAEQDKKKVDAINNQSKENIPSTTTSTATVVRFELGKDAAGSGLVSVYGPREKCIFCCRRLPLVSYLVGPSGVWIRFDKKVSDDFGDKYLEFLKNKIQEHHKSEKFPERTPIIRHGQEIRFKVKMEYEQVQELIAEVNKHFADQNIQDH